MARDIRYALAIELFGERRRQSVKRFAYAAYNL